MIEVSPACHARPENIWKEQVIGAVQGMVEETNRCYGTSGQVAGRSSTCWLTSKVNDRKVTLNGELRTCERLPQRQRVLIAGDLYSVLGNPITDTCFEPSFFAIKGKDTISWLRPIVLSH